MVYIVYDSNNFITMTTSNAEDIRNLSTYSRLLTFDYIEVWDTCRLVKVFHRKEIPANTSISDALIDIVTEFDKNLSNKKTHFYLIRKMGVSNLVAILALITSIIAVPSSSLISYRTAIQTIKFQNSEESVLYAIECREKLHKTVFKLDILFCKTVEEVCGISIYNENISSKDLELINKNLEPIFDSIENYAIAETLRKDILAFEDSGFDIIFANKDIEGYANFSTLAYNASSNIDDDDYIYSCYKAFMSEGVMDDINAITDEEIREYFEDKVAIK